VVYRDEGVRWWVENALRGVTNNAAVSKLTGIGSAFTHTPEDGSTSRRGDPDKLFVYGNLDANGERWVANPVYREILPKYTCVVACKVQDSIRLRRVWRARPSKKGPNGEAIERAPLL
jgi:hypothetical protein